MGDDTRAVRLVEVAPDTLIAVDAIVSVRPATVDDSRTEISLRWRDEPLFVHAPAARVINALACSGNVSVRRSS